MDDIPFEFVPRIVLHGLAVVLNPPHLNNWKMLGEKLNGYTTQYTEYVESLCRDRPCTEVVFEHFTKNVPDATVGKVRAALESMKRQDALDVLNDNMEEIEKMYREAQKNGKVHSTRQPVENSYQWSSKFSQHSAMCPCCVPGYTSQGSAPGPAYGIPHGHMTNHQPRQSSPVAHPPLPRHESYGHAVHHAHPFHSGHFDRSRMERGSDSMIVNGERCPEVSMDVEMGEVMYSHSGVPLHQGIWRGENHFASFGESMGRPGAIDVGREEVVTTSGQQSENVFFNRMGQVGRPGYFNQHSEENNARQPLTQKRSAHVIKKIVTNPDAAPLGSRSPASPPISKLQKLADLPRQFQPDQNYKNFVAEQKVDEAQFKGRPIKEERIELPETDGYERLNLHNLRDKNGMPEKPRTFPRVKSHSPMNSFNGISTNGQQHNSLTKSASLPVDMKPAEFRRGFRYIRVFVTYSNDNKRHLQRVLSLCNCIVKNGFSCCVDVNNRFVSTLPNHQDRVMWYKEKFKESDFILVCPSEKYKEDTSGGEGTPLDSLHMDQLHTRLIYRLMYEEYQTQGKNTRFVPVLFDGIPETLLPQWLHTALKYRWPSQYKDLLWMLTRPEDRMKPKAKLYSDSNSQSNSPKHEGAY